MALPTRTPTAAIRGLAGLAVIALMSGCSGTTAATTSPTTSATSATTSTTSTSPTTASGVDVESFLASLTAANLTLKTFTTSTTITTRASDKETKITSSGKIDQTDPAKRKMQMESTYSGQESAAIIIGKDYYTKIAGQWFKVSEKQMKQTGGRAPNDMSTWLQDARTMIEKVELVGDETIKGVPTKRYRVTMDGAALAKLTPSGGIDLDTFIYDMWLGNDNLVRQYALDLIEGSTEMSLVSTMDDFNEPVTIKAPAKYTDMPG